VDAVSRTVLAYNYYELVIRDELIFSVNRKITSSVIYSILDWAILFGFMASSRLVWRVYREIFVIPSGKTKSPRTLVVGAGEIGHELMREIRKNPRANYNVVGFLDDDPVRQGLTLGGVPVLGDTQQISRLIKDMKI